MAYVYQVKHKETGEFYIGSKKQGGVCGMTRYHFDNCKDKGQ